MFNVLSVHRGHARVSGRAPRRLPGRVSAFLLSCLLCVWPGQAWARELVVIVSTKSPVTALQPQQVAAIFLAEGGRFPGGGDVAALDQKLGSAARNEFYAKVAGRSPEQMKAHWTKMMFTGRGQPPREVAGNAAVRRLVAADPALIGYIDSSAVNASVRAVLVLK